MIINTIPRMTVTGQRIISPAYDPINRNTVAGKAYADNGLTGAAWLRRDTAVLCAESEAAHAAFALTAQGVGK